MLPGAVASPSQGSLLNVQNLYHLQLAQAPLTQPAMLNKPQPVPSLLHLTGLSQQDQQHLGPGDQLDQQQDLLNRLDDTDPGEGSMPLPANTDYKHKPRRKASERPLVSSSHATLLEGKTCIHCYDAAPYQLQCIQTVRDCQRFCAYVHW